MEKDSQLVKNGKKTIQIKGKTGVKQFERQILRKKTSEKIETIIPINNFFEGTQRGKGIVSKNLEEEVISEVLISSYRNSEKRSGGKLGKETIRRLAIRKGKKAEELEKTAVKRGEKKEHQIKDAERAEDSYKKSKSGFMRSFFGKIFKRRILYFMADGVGVEQQIKGKEGKRECKVGVFLKQTEDKIDQIATFCTWQRIDGFKNMLGWVLLPIFSTIYPIIIISDGAKWIRNLRNKISCLKNAVWILDWFHLKDRTLKLLRKFDIDENSKIAKKIVSLFWFGQIEIAIAEIKQITLSEDEEEKKDQIEAIEKYEIYIDNQQEGIINYQAYKMKGYVVGSGCVEKMNDKLIKDRMVRQKRMRWGLEGGEAIMQLLTSQWNGRLSELFA